MLPCRILGAAITVGRSATTVRHPRVDRPLRAGPGWLVANQREARLTIDGVGTFSIEEGRFANVDLVDGADLMAVRECIYGPVATIVAGQRGAFALHATSVDLGGAAVAIAGSAGVGKSTAGLRLQQRGHPLIADDLSPVEVRRVADGSIRALVVPFGRPVHLWPETAAAIGLRIPESPATVAGSRKVALPAPDALPDELARIVVLELDDAAASVQSSRVSATMAVPLLTAHVHGIGIVAEIWPEQVFSWAASVAATVPVHRLVRPASRPTIDETADEVESLAADIASPA